MTYRELRDKLNGLTEDQLDKEVTVMEDNAIAAWYPADYGYPGDNHPLNPTHPVILF